MKILVGITGGIGSGKSVVSKICRIKGFPVYDCDSRAKFLMQSSRMIKEELVKIIGPQVLRQDGTINKSLLAENLFTKDDIRNRVNFIVHNAVLIDIEEWIEQQKSEIIFIESAILSTSHLDKKVNKIWYVDATEEERVKRVKLRDNLSEDAIKKRIASQNREMESLSTEKIQIISNDGQKSLIEQINHLLDIMSNKKKINN